MNSLSRTTLAGAIIGALLPPLVFGAYVGWIYLRILISSYFLAQAFGQPVTIFTIPFFEDGSGHPISPAYFFAALALAGAMAGTVLGAITGLVHPIFQRLIDAKKTHAKQNL